MKKATIKYPYGEIAEDVRILNCAKDVAEYIQEFSDEAVTDFSRSCRVPQSRISHLNNGSCVTTANILSEMRGTSLANEMSSLIHQKSLNLLRAIGEGETVIVNSSGGYTYLTDEYEILSIKDHNRYDTYHIGNNSKYINLENDAELEQRTIDYLSNKEDDFSYILNLKRYNKKELCRVFKEFQSNGGETVYVYTTGIDVEQMYTYMNCAISSDISKFEFEFNAGITEEISKFIHKYKRLSYIDFKVI